MTSRCKHQSVQLKFHIRSITSSWRLARGKWLHGTEASVTDLLFLEVACFDCGYHCIFKQGQKRPSWVRRAVVEEQETVIGRGTAWNVIEEEA